MLLEAFALPDQGSFQDDAALLVALAVLSGKLIDPAQFAVAVLAAHVPDHVAPSEHDPVLNFTVLQIYHLGQTHSAQGTQGISLPTGNMVNDHQRVRRKEPVALHPN